MFRFSERFITDFLPSTIELGRSFVSLDYQSSKAGARALYALDNLWDGLGALTVVYPQINYLFGKVTMYPDYGEECRGHAALLPEKAFLDPDRLVEPIDPLKTNPDIARLSSVFNGTCFKEDYRILNHNVREHGLNIPPLVNAYTEPFAYDESFRNSGKPRIRRSGRDRDIRENLRHIRGEEAETYRDLQALGF